MLFGQYYYPMWVLYDWMLLPQWWWDLTSSHQEGEQYRQPAVTRSTMRKQRGFCGPGKTDWMNRRPPKRPGRTLNLLSRLRWRHVQVWIKSDRSSVAWQRSVCLLSRVCFTLLCFCWKIEWSYCSYLSLECLLLTDHNLPQVFLILTAI